MENKENKKENPVNKLAEECGVSKVWVYEIAKKIGRLPTAEEINERKGKRGRPSKWW